MITHEQVYRIGRIGKPHGVKGEVSLQFSDDVFDRVDADYLVLETDGILVPFFMEEYRFRNDSAALVKFEGIDTQERARELTHCDVYFPYSLSDGNEQQFSWNEIVGFSLIDADTQQPVGEITAIDDSTINILFHVERDGEEILIPASDELIQSVSMDQREIEITLPDGILDL
ncbi:MAG: 16S rRNA processing protein RimM [Prevotella sp.]|uniref:ribosome maturation factor RimM n=1 Tax=Prevotella sp. Rep29 TaxID=2691580 RepID=UPI001C6F3B27|nr:ribosome maturation factor RimM [Prevotella sp. Rep29]MBR3445753.1 16S rRNA processing protein RimM [Prevotella sp.]MBR7093750.1 16S rRNA processing protein RimM [Prevotella sp.]QYR11484.1 16S rRNA processing protein RimM [Prevotella sp. Rep29]